MSAIQKEEVVEYLTPQQYSGFDVSYMDTQRRPKFSKGELDALVSGVSEHRGVLLPPNGTAPHTKRQDCWKEILERVNVVADPDSQRTLPEVVKRWRYLKSRTRVKARRLTKWDKSLNEIQRRVMEVVGDRETTTGEDNDEDGWDEGYEIDVGDVTAGDLDDDEPAEPQDVPGTEQQSSSGQYVPTDAVMIKSEPTTQAAASGHVGGNVSHDTMPSSSRTNSSFRDNTVIGPGRIRNGIDTRREPMNTDHGMTGRYERAPSLDDNYPTSNQNYRDVGFQSERHNVDKNNVNITVQSCSCHHGNQSKTTDEQRLELERERLEIEKRRLEIERGRLAIEDERLRIEKERVNMPAQKLT